MASTLSFLTVAGSPISLFRHWALAIILCSLLSSDIARYFLVNANPTLVLHALPNYTTGDSNRPIEIMFPANSSYPPNPLVTVPLKNVSFTFHLLAFIRTYYLSFTVIGSKY